MKNIIWNSILPSFLYTDSSTGIQKGDFMQIIIIILICFISSAAGSVCGIGGGVIIKPVLDAAGIMDTVSVSFLSGCTVLSMSAVSLYKNLKIRENRNFDKLFASILALGSILGGILGKSAFQYILKLPEMRNRAAAIQSFILLVITAGTLVYELRKAYITSKTVKNKAAVFIIGCFLGILSAFLGIGGGPLNLIVLFYLFSMDTKEAALYSIYIILFSQAASLFYSIYAGNVPHFSAGILALMIGCGISGGLAGSAASKHMSPKAVDRIFIGLMGVMILINMFNIFRYF